ncbi:MAG: hypothetical protein HY717_22880 [Planctomycetes bacterium]|nr:hypothetical protein [Planctomycetota bacterium]
MTRLLNSSQCFVLTIGLIASGCLSNEEELKPPPGSAKDTGVRFDEGRYFAAPVQVKNLTVWPIYTDKPAVVGEFLTLKEAEDKGLAAVSEVGAGGPEPSPTSVPGQSTAQNDLSQILVPGSSATVNRLMIENKGDLPILVCGGTVVKGGKQDRQIAQDFVIAPKTKVPVNAFCIEHGRWQGVREGEPTLGIFKSQEVVTLNEVRYYGQYDGDQDAVWRSVREGNLVAGKSPSTGTLLATLEESDPAVLARRREKEREVSGHFQALRSKGQSLVGFAYAVNGKPITVRAFAHERLLEGQFEAFLKAMCLEADLSAGAAKRAGSAASQPAKLQDVLDMVAAINQEKEAIEATSAANRKGFRRNVTGGNFNCYLELPRAAAAPTAETVLFPISQDWTRAAVKK